MTPKAPTPIHYSHVSSIKHDLNRLIFFSVDNADQIVKQTVLIHLQTISGSDTYQRRLCRLAI